MTEYGFFSCLDCGEKSFIHDKYCCRCGAKFITEKQVIVGPLLASLYKKNKAIKSEQSEKSSEFCKEKEGKEEKEEKEKEENEGKEKENLINSKMIKNMEMLIIDAGLAGSDVQEARERKRMARIFGEIVKSPGGTLRI